MIYKIIYFVTSSVIFFFVFQTINSEIVSHYISGEINNTSISQFFVFNKQMSYFVPILFILTNFVFSFVPLRTVDSYDNLKDEVKEEKPKKQTYLEYVEERLTVEKMLGGS